MRATDERWGQPPISLYSISSDGENMYATALYDPYGELSSSSEPRVDLTFLGDEDVEDLSIFMETRDEPLTPWQEVKEELARDGLL
jgi:hypothetical protein